MNKIQVTSRKRFIVNAGKAGIAATLSLQGFPALAGMAGPDLAYKYCNNESSGWVQQPLNYPYNALEPAIDATTMEIHYKKHAATYAKNLADAVKNEGVDTDKMTIEELLSEISKYSVKMRNNAGGHYNHELFWKLMSAPSGTSSPSGKLLAAVQRDFGSLEAFQTQFADAAKSRFGSGWAWLILNNDKKLVIASSPNQDNPLMNIADIKGFPLLGLDVWEHAYYLKYQNKRPEYINAWWRIINWEYVQKRFSDI